MQKGKQSKPSINWELLYSTLDRAGIRHDLCHMPSNSVMLYTMAKRISWVPLADENPPRPGYYFVIAKDNYSPIVIYLAVAYWDGEHFPQKGIWGNWTATHYAPIKKSL